MKSDGVIKSPIRGVIMLGRTFDMLHVCFHDRPNTMPCLWAIFYSHLQAFSDFIIIKYLKIWILFVIFALSAMLASHVCAEVLTLQYGQRYMNVQKHFDYIEDPNGVFSFDDVFGGKENLAWIENTHSGLNFGYTDSVIWVKGTIENSSLKEEVYVLEIAYPVIDDMCVYILRDKISEKLHMGDKLPFHERPVKHRNFLIPVRFDAGEKVTLVLRVKTTSSMQIPINIYQEDVITAKTQTDMLGLSLYYGAMLMMVLYNLFIYFSIKESMYVYYVFYVFFMTLWATSLNGISFQYLWPEATVWNDQVIIFALNGIIFFASMFAARFLDAKQAYPTNYRLFLTLPTVSFVMMIFAYFIPYRAGISSAMIIAVVTILYGSAITFMRLADGFKLARVFILAWAMVLGGGVVMALSKFALLPRNMITETAVQIGSVLEVALLSFALAHRLNLEKKQRIEAQNIANIHERHARIAKENELLNERKVRAAREEALAVQKCATETLESKILERRAELNESLNKVRVTHDKIMESLAYARIIQSAMLPDPEDFLSLLPRHFIWYAPRDIVGGDFYYIDAIEKGVIVVVADCTGHGVPGAFMTLIANWELKRIVKGEKCYDPDEILVRMNRRIKKTLKQDKDSAFSDDGLDMAVCVFNPGEKNLTYAGARIDLRYIKDKKVHTVKSDKRSIGYIALKGDYGYKVHHMTIEPGMTVYLSTDGITDQLGEKTSQRFGTNRLNEVLAAHSELPLAQQCERLKETLMAHRGERDQVDDMTMVAFNAEF